MTEAEVPVPPQYQEAQVIDFRNAMLGPRGYKMSRKRKIEEKEEQVLSHPSLIGFQAYQTSSSKAVWQSATAISTLLINDLLYKQADKACLFLAQAEMEANEMQEADTAGVPAQTSKRQKLNIVGIGKVRQVPY